MFILHTWSDEYSVYPPKFINSADSLEEACKYVLTKEREELELQGVNQGYYMLDVEGVQMFLDENKVTIDISECDAEAQEAFRSYFREIDYGRDDTTYLTYLEFPMHIYLLKKHLVDNRVTVDPFISFNWSLVEADLSKDYICVKDSVYSFTDEPTDGEYWELSELETWPSC